jgi:hypothetical protein
MITDTNILNSIGFSPSPTPKKGNRPRKSTAVDTLAHSVSANDSPRFRQLFELASEGEEASIGDLWLEFAFDFNPAHT